MSGWYRSLTRLGWLALALLTLVNAGCLLAVAGAAGAGAAAGYYYYNGLLYRDYHASLGDTHSAVRASLAELQFPVLEQKSDTGSYALKTRTADGYTVRVYLDTVPSRVPIDGSVTRVSVRVGFSGDELVSARILEQVSSHLVAPGLRPIPAPGVSGVQMGTPKPLDRRPAVQPASFETTPPPLAPVAATPSRPAVAPLQPPRKP